MYFTRIKKILSYVGGIKAFQDAFESHCYLNKWLKVFIFRGKTQIEIETQFKHCQTTRTDILAENIREGK